jgi:predicted transcriptional regulator
MTERKHPILTGEKVRFRRTLGWLVAGEGGSQVDYANLLGVTPAAVCKWLDMWPDLRAVLRANSKRRTSVDPAEATRRLRIVAMSDIGRGTRSAAAREIGLSPAGLAQWLSRHETELQDTINEINSERERRAA